MNKTKIEWTDYTWNPITGCKNDCWYCYAKKMFKRFNKSFEPEFHPDRLNDLKKLKKPSKIFVCSVSDIFAEWTKSEWRDAVLEEIKKYPQHTFQLLTKQPHLIDKNYIFPDNVWVGATVTNGQELRKIREIINVKCKIKFISFEPLLDYIIADFKGLDWIIVGKLTGSNRVLLQNRWVADILKVARYHSIPIFIKDNVGWHKKIQEFPKLLGCDEK